VTEETQTIIYRDAKGNITARQIHSISESGEHFQAVCLKARALRTFRKDRVLEYIENESEIDQRLAFHIENNPEPAPRRYQNSLNKLEVCFTGFPGSEKVRLKEYAESAGLYVRTSVTKKLTILCYGNMERAGPSKMDKARRQGVIVLSLPQFETMLNTGEIPEEP
jgi:NAD-dependent DNA ligase